MISSFTYLFRDMPRKYRIYHPCECQSGPLRIVDAETLHYLRNVVRIRTGEQLTLFGKGSMEWIGRVQAMDSEGIVVDIQETNIPLTEPSVRIHLGVAAGKGYKLDEVVEMTTALGVTSILPFIANYSVTERRNPDRLDRLKKIAISACRQSGRVQVPQIESVSESLQVLLKHQAWPLLLFADERGGIDLVDFSIQAGAENFKEAALFIGPEGGWSDMERELLKGQGGIPVHLGPRILRMELAASMAVMLLERLLGRIHPAKPGCMSPSEATP